MTGWADGAAGVHHQFRTGLVVGALLRHGIHVEPIEEDGIVTNRMWIVLDDDGLGTIRIEVAVLPVGVRDD